MRCYYDIKLIFKYLFMIFAFVFVCKFSKGYAYPILIPITLYYLSVRKFENLLFLVLISLGSIVCNAWFMPKTMLFAVSQRGMLVMLGASLLFSIIGRPQALSIKPLKWFLFYIFYMACVSCVGWSPLISYLKIFLFTIIFLAFYATANAVGMRFGSMVSLRSMVLAVIAFFVVGSILLIPFPGIGNMSTQDLLNMVEIPTSLFKGMTVHSQTLGPLVTTCAVLLLADMIFSLQRTSWVYLILFGMAMVLIYKTGSRTAMGAFMAGLFFVFWCIGKTKSVRRSWKSKVVQLMLLLGICGSLAIFIVPSMRAKAAKFIVKSEQDSTLVTKERILHSRKHVHERTIDNWRKSPLIGNGFQVSEEMLGFQANSIKDVLTAPVEKSTWIYAILEEGGTVGMIIFCVMALSILHSLLKWKAYIGASCFFTMLVLNLGEFTMFAMSGVGGFIWGMVFAGCAIDARRQKELHIEEMAARMAMEGGPRF